MGTMFPSLSQDTRNALQVCSCTSSHAQDERFALVGSTSSGCVNSSETAWWLVTAWRRGVREETSASTSLKKKF